jgi:hypothetical protein
MANENERPLLAQLRQSVVQFQVQLRKGAGFRAGIAPPIAAAVIGADTGEGRDAGLHQRPVEGEIAEPVFHDDRGPAMTRAVHMKFMAAQIHQFPGRCGRCGQGSEGHGRDADDEEWNHSNHWAR